MTANKAAAEVRHAIIRKMRELELEMPMNASHRWDRLNTYINGMAKRASSKKGGLGRK